MKSREAMVGPITTSDQSRIAKIRAFLRDAFSDYVAARVLLLANLPHQGAVLSSTAIEKCIKALLGLSGQPKRSHLNPEHWEALLQFDSNAARLFDREFIGLNEKVYRLRYTNSLPNDFNLVVASREFLAEMDHTVNIILSCFKIDENGKRHKTLFQQASETGDARVLAENHMVSGPRKALFVLQKPQFVYEVRRDSARGLVEVTYSSNEPAKRPGFLREGLIPLDTEHSGFEFSHYPIKPPEPDASHDIRLSFSG